MRKYRNFVVAFNTMRYFEFNREEIDRFRNLLDNSKRVAIVCHMTPDGDALGSSLCLMHTLAAMGKHASVVTPDAPPKTLGFMPGFEHVIVNSFQHDKARNVFANADMIVCLDFNDLRRIDRAATLVESSNVPVVMVDHHLNPVLQADIAFSRPEISSTCALLFLVLEAAGLAEHIGRDAATCCCAGMMTDTGNFAYNANDPALYRILAELIERGVDKNDLYNRLFNTNTLARIRIMGFCQYARMHILEQHRCAITSLTLSEAREFNYSKGDTEGLVNIPLSIPGVVYSIFLRQDEENYVKVSMRSKGNFSVKDLCENFFDGGGHLNASGGEIKDSFDNAMARILDILPVADKMLESYRES